MPMNRRTIIGWTFLMLGSSIGRSQWEPINTGFPDAVVDSVRKLYSISSLFSYGTDLFVGTGHPTTGEALTIRSTDSGTFWTAASNGLPIGEYARSFTSNGPILFAGTNGMGVYRTTDNGAVWTRASSGLSSPTYVFSMTSFQGKILAGTLEGIFISTNNGSSWGPLDVSEIIRGVHAFAIIDSHLFAGAGSVHILKYDTAWSVVRSERTGGEVYSLLAVGKTLFAGTFNGVYRSTDLGATWIASSTGMAGSPPLQIWSLAACGSDIFAATYFGGVYRSTNNGSIWRKMNYGLLSSTPAKLAVIDNELFLGTRDDGMYKYVPFTSGDLTVTLNDAEDWGVLGPGGRVELYSISDEMIYQEITDASSQATFSAIPEATGYYYRAYANRNTAWDEPFWGEKTGIAITANQTTNDTFTHNTPYMPGLRVYIDSTNELLPDGTQRLVTPGTRLRIELDIKNPAYDGARPVSAYGGVRLDRDKVAPFDLTAYSDPQNMGTDTTSTFVIYCNTPAKPGPYYLSVAAFATSNRYTTALTDASGWHDPAFAVVQAPAVPILASPADRSVNQPATLTFSWQSVVGALAYHLQLAPDSTFTSGVLVNDSTIVDTSRASGPLSYSTTYYWRVRAKISDGMSDFSLPWRFRTLLPLPIQVQLSSPASGTSANVSTVGFVWRKASPEVTRYWFEIASDSQFVFNTLDSTLADTFYVRQNLVNGTYWWRVKAYNSSGWGAFSESRRLSVVTTGLKELNEIPTAYVLDQNYPNPFNPSTVLRFGLPSASHVTLIVYNALGQEIKTLVSGSLNAGYHVIRVDGSGLPSGVYFCRMTARDFVATIALHLVK